MRGQIDHLIVAAETLEAGSAALEPVLGLPLEMGGEHEVMGTHNRLLSLGNEDYLEVISINPEGKSPDDPRWFNLDRFSGAPRLTHWALRVSDLDLAWSRAPEGCGRTRSLVRGDLSWRIAIPRSGQTPFDGLFPMLLEWESAHPAGALLDVGVRLEKLVLESPEAEALSAALRRLIDDPRLHIQHAETPGISAHLSTPAGPVRLGPAP